MIEMKERLYIAEWDDGHDRGDFEFYSCYRAGSRQNKEDAYKEYRKRYGKRNVIFTCIYLK